MTGSAPRPDFISRAEAHAGRGLVHRDAVSALAGAAGRAGLAGDFERLLFLAKFWQRGRGIVERTGAGADEVRELGREMAAAGSEIAALLGKLFDAGSMEEAASYRARFLTADAESFARLEGLLADLVVLKNFGLHEAGR